MNPATSLTAEAPAAPSLPAEPTLAAQPVGLTSGKPFAKIMEGTVTDVPAEPVPKKDEQAGDGDTKKNGAVLVAMMNIPVTAPVVLPVLPIPAADPVLALVKAEVPAVSDTNVQSQDVVATGHTAEPATPEVSTIPPSAVPVTVGESGARLPTNSPLAVGMVAPEQMKQDSHPTAAGSTASQQTLQPLEGEGKQVLSAEQAQPDGRTVPDGTVIAKQDSRMKRDVKVDENSAPTEKTLPRGNFSTITKAESTRPSRNREAFSEAAAEPTESARESFVPREKPTSIYGTAVAEFKHFDVRVSTDGVSVDSVRTPQAEKVFNGISEQVVAFRKVGVNSMDAVLRPDRGTEISLHLSLGNNGQVDVVARVERGNFEGLQAHWSELQSSLAQQGVRVGELHQSSLNNQASSHESSQNFGTATGDQQQAQQQTSRSSEMFEELPLLGSVKPLKEGISTPTPTRSRGWEKWA